MSEYIFDYITVMWFFTDEESLCTFLTHFFMLSLSYYSYEIFSNQTKEQTQEPENVCWGEESFSQNFIDFFSKIFIKIYPRLVAVWTVTRGLASLSVRFSVLFIKKKKNSMVRFFTSKKRFSKYFVRFSLDSTPRET